MLICTRNIFCDRGAPPSSPRMRMEISSGSRARRMLTTAASRSRYDVLVEVDTSTDMDTNCCIWKCQVSSVRETQVGSVPRDLPGPLDSLLRRIPQVVCSLQQILRARAPGGIQAYDQFEGWAALDHEQLEGDAGSGRSRLLRCDL